MHCLNCQMDNLPFIKIGKECFPISTILENNPKETYLSDTLLLKRFSVLDICYSDSRRSCCFTKAYGRYLEGTGSIYTNKSQTDVKEVMEKINSSPIGDCDRLNLLKSLNLRFFTPREVCRLMCIPETFTFPSDITDRKKYMLLGNSINVKVVSELIKVLSS